MSVGSKGASADQFLEPAGIAITEDDRVLVADCWNHRIQVLTMEFLALVGTKDKGPLQFEFPTSIVIHPNEQVKELAIVFKFSTKIHILSLVCHKWTTTRR